MLYKICWTLLLLPLCVAFNRKEPRTLCGVPAWYGGHSIQAYLDNKSDKLVLPWTVAIRNNLGKFKCLGSIIPDDNYGGMPRNFSALIMTAGSCFRRTLGKRWGSPRHYKLYAGLDRLRLFLNSGQKSRAKSIRIMPYNAVNENIWNGVALVTLRSPFVFNKHVSPVCLAGEYAVPPDTSLCFVSTYHRRRLDEEVVRMVPGSVCRFGHFPELARTGGLCSHHERSDSEKSLGGPLVCIINGKAHQFGVYLSQLITKKALSFHKQALHYYGHVTTVLERDPATASRLIQLGSTGEHANPSDSSSSSSQDCCRYPPPPRPEGHTPPSSRPAPSRPVPPPCVRPTRPQHVIPTRPARPPQHSKPFDSSSSSAQEGCRYPPLPPPQGHMPPSSRPAPSRPVPPPCVRPTRPQHVIPTRPARPPQHSKPFDSSSSSAQEGCRYPPLPPPNGHMPPTSRPAPSRPAPTPCVRPTRPQHVVPTRPARPPQHSKSSESSSSSAKEGCRYPPPPQSEGHMPPSSRPAPSRPAPPPCVRPTRPQHVIPTRPARPPQHSKPFDSSSSSAQEGCRYPPLPPPNGHVPPSSRPAPSRPAPPPCVRPTRPQHVIPTRPARPPQHSKSSESSSSSAQEGCRYPPPPQPNGHMPPSSRPAPSRPAPPPCVRPTRPQHVIPARPARPLQPPPVYCGDTITFGRTLQSYVIGNNAQDMFPWNVIITSRVLGSTRCIGSLVHKGDLQQRVNSSDVVLTAADCFARYRRSIISLRSRLRVYAGSPRFSRLRRRGKKVKIANVALYGLPWENKRIRGGVAIVKLERPLLRKDNVVPVCLAKRESVPPPYASCYVTHYDKHEHRIDEEIIMVTRNARCLAARNPNAPLLRGICAVEQKKKHYIQLGSPMVCIVNGRAYQYGVYLNQLSLKINDKVKQNLGFYSELTVVHDVFAGKNVQTLPENVNLRPGQPSHRPVHASSSSSSSGSHESYGLPIRPVPSIPRKFPRKPVRPARPPRRHSKSTSASYSSSDSSSEGTSTSQEHTARSRSSEETDESSRVIHLNVKVVKPYLDRWIQNIRRKRVPPPPPSRSSHSSSHELVPRPLPNGPSQPNVICRYPSQRPIGPPDSHPSNGIVICPMPGSAVQVVPLPTPLPTAEYPSSSIEAVGMVILPTLPKYDLTNSTIATHDHILVRDNIIGESAIAQGSSASCSSLSIDGELNSLLPSKWSGEVTGNEIPNHIPDVYGRLVTETCTLGGSDSHSRHHHTMYLPGASGVHIFEVSGSSIQPLCTGALYVRPGEMYSDEVVTATRCIPSSTANKYRVYMGSLLPRRMTVEQLGKTLVEVEDVYSSHFYAQYSEYDDLKRMGMTVLKLKHRVKITNGVESFPLPYAGTGASSGMPCYVSGVCQHGMPVRVQYKLLTPKECAERLGHKYLPNVMYCGIGEKKDLQYPVGSPLVCRTSGTWTQFGIYDQSVHNAMERVVGYKGKQEPSEITLFVKLEDDDVARIQTMQTNAL